MFSLCIPTMDRYDAFLEKTLPNYIDNEFITEIIISDENGNDVEKIKNFIDSPKIKHLVNKKTLGTFRNKIRACRAASNDWIVLIDSDNYAGTEYFRTAKDFINNHQISKESILAPSWAKPDFDFRGFEGRAINRKTIKSMKKKRLFKTLVNTGNFVINKYLVHSVNLANEDKNIAQSSSCDVVYFNTLLFEQFDLNIHIVPNMHYDHIVHNGSIYKQKSTEFREFNKSVYKRLEKLGRRNIFHRFF